MQRTLLAATAALAAEHDPETALEEACRSLVDASPHIEAAWVYLLQGQVFKGLHAAGNLPDTFKRVDSLEALSLALDARGLRDSDQITCFVFYGRDTRGCFGLLADRPDYVEAVGAAPFHLFANVAGSLISQARLRAELRERAEFDDLTRVLNRGAVQDALVRIHASAQRSGAPYALLLCDIDHFKAINDHHGHQLGDRVLVQVAQQMQAALRQGDWLGRWGGEEFLVILPRTEADEALEIAERMRRQVAEGRFAAEHHVLKVTLSAGVSCYPLDGVDTQMLLSIADAALYEAKDAGRNRAQRATRRGRRLYNLAARIEEGLRAGRVRPAFQPIVALKDGAVVGEESLARLVSRGRQVMPAADFIEVANLRHLIHRIDAHMFRCTLEHCRAQDDPGGKRLHFVNVSAGLLRHPELIAEMAASLGEQSRLWREDAAGHQFVVEITERDFVDPAQAQAMLAPLLECGVRLALDDFGSGYSSFSYLVELPVEFVKIEGVLVRKALRDRKARAVLCGIRDVARETGLVTLAEGVEDAPTAELMRTLEIDLVQGFHFGAPELPAH